MKKKIFSAKNKTKKDTKLKEIVLIIKTDPELRRDIRKFVQVA